LSDNKKLLKSTLLVTILSVSGIFVGLLLQLLIAKFYGASILRDLYFISIAIPLFLTSVINGSFGLIFLPKIISVIEEGKKNRINEFITTSFIFIFFITFFILLIYWNFNQILIKLIFNSYNLVEQNYIAELLFILMPTIIFNVFSNLLSSLYHIKSNFLVPAVVVIFSSIFNILFFYSFNDLIGIKSLAYGYLLGTIVSSIILLPSLFVFRFKFKFLNIDLISVLKTSFPLFLGGFFFRSTNVLEKYLASRLVSGSISYLGYSSQILVVLGTLTSNGIGTTIYPVLSDCWSKKNFVGFLNFFNKSIRIILLLTIPTSFFILVYSEFIISIIFERGEFTNETTIAVSEALKYSIPAFVFQGLGTVLAKLFYISGKTNITTAISFFEILLFLVLSIFLIPKFSYLGISLSFSISTFINIILSFYFAERFVIKFNYRKLIFDSVKIILVSIIFLFFVKCFSEALFFTGQFFSFFLSTIGGVLIFVVLGIVFKIEELLYLFVRVKHILGKFRFIVRKHES
jgi:putative peptidoglycan lipid II flippase